MKKTTKSKLFANHWDKVTAYLSIYLLLSFCVILILSFTKMEWIADPALTLVHLIFLLLCLIYYFVADKQKVKLSIRRGLLATITAHFLLVMSVLALLIFSVSNL